jgi:hypothetical protein
MSEVTRVEPLAPKARGAVRGLGILIILLALCHALLYAITMPPWDLLDEAPHFHYVQMIAEEHRLPIMWQDKLSPEIVDSMYAVKRWEVHGWPTPSREEFPNLLESESYEAYQPPLYYALLALVYPWAPADVLGKLFTLRIASAILGCVTLIVAWMSTRLLWPDRDWMAVVATLFVALLPERVAATARVSNDVLLEVTSALAFGALALIVARGPSWKRSMLLGLALAAAVLSKPSAWMLVPIAFLSWLWAAKLRWRASWHVLKQSWLILALPALVALPLLQRNLVLYHDLSGVQAFMERTGPFAQGPFPVLLALSIRDLLVNSWAIVWDGSQVVSKPSAGFLQAALVLETALLAGVIVYSTLKRKRRHDCIADWMLFTGGLTLVVFAASTVTGYIRGFLPVVQGRFMLPAMLPTAWLLAASLWQMAAQWRDLLALLLLFLETALGMSVLFFHSLPKFYAPSGVGFLGYWQQSLYLLFSPAGMFRDKPAWVGVEALGLAGVAFGILAVSIAVLALRRYGSPITRSQLQTGYAHIRAWELEPGVRPARPLAAPHFARLHQVLRSPLFWTVCALLFVYMIWVMAYPPETFWSLDEGGKYIHLQSILRSGDLSSPLIYPGLSVDPSLRFVPLLFWSQSGSNIYSWWPVGFQLLALPFYELLGWLGLYVIPVVSGVCVALFSGLLVQRMRAPGRWLPAAAALITGLATPVAFYSTTYWEHTFSVACVLAALLCVVHGWETGRARWVVIAGMLLALATYLRTDSAAIAAGVGLVLLILWWRWAVLLGIAFALTSSLWLISNWLLMGHPLGRQWIPGGVSLSTPLFGGLREAGVWFVPYVLFNAPQIGAFPLDSWLLALATLLTALALATPWLSRFQMLGWSAYGGLFLVCGWVLLRPEGYRSVHGLLLIAPHIVFATWLYRTRINGRQQLVGSLFLGLSVTYAAAYVARSWVAAGGLQWGPRYLLAFYPLCVAASITGLAFVWPSLRNVLRYSLLLLYACAVLVGLGYQVRGTRAAMQTRQYYHQTQQAIQELDTETIVTECPWLTMVMPTLYWSKPVFVIHPGTSFENWVAEARQAGVHSVCRVEMDMCGVTFLDEIAARRATDPDGIQVQCFSE